MIRIDAHRPITEEAESFLRRSRFGSCPKDFGVPDEELRKDEGRPATANTRSIILLEAYGLFGPLVQPSHMCQRVPHK